MTAKPRSEKALARVDAQRERILCAAQHCFVEHGFHAAGMAKIAETAEMSPGLIYRYFENKAAIIQAIVERQLELLREDIRLNRRIDLAQELLDKYGRHAPDDHRRLSAALLLELSAEATRDPQIASSVRHFDSELRSALTVWLMRPLDESGYGLPPEQARRRALMLQVIFEGLKIRETREPDLDRELLGAALRELLPRLMQD